MTVDSAALEEFDYFEEIEEMDWNFCNVIYTNIY